MEQGESSPRAAPQDDRTASDRILSDPERLFRLLAQELASSGAAAFWSNGSLFRRVVSVSAHVVSQLSAHGLPSGEESLSQLLGFFNSTLPFGGLEALSSLTSSDETFLSLCYLVTQWIAFASKRRYPPSLKCSLTDAVRHVFESLPPPLQRDVYPGIMSFALRRFTHRKEHHSTLESTVFLFRSLVLVLQPADEAGWSLLQPAAPDPWAEESLAFLDHNLPLTLPPLLDNPSLPFREFLCREFLLLLPACHPQIGDRLLHPILSLLGDVSDPSLLEALVSLLREPGTCSIRYFRSIEGILSESLLSLPDACFSRLSSELDHTLSGMSTALRVLTSSDYRCSCLDVERFVLSLAKVLELDASSMEFRSQIHDASLATSVDHPPKVFQHLSPASVERIPAVVSSFARFFGEECVLQVLLSMPPHAHYILFMNLIEWSSEHSQVLLQHLSRASEDPIALGLQFEGITRIFQRDILVENLGSLWTILDGIGSDSRFVDSMALACLSDLHFDDVFRQYQNVIFEGVFRRIHSWSQYPSLPQLIAFLWPRMQQVSESMLYELVYGLFSALEERPSTPIFRCLLMMTEFSGTTATAPPHPLQEFLPVFSDSECYDYILQRQWSVDDFIGFFVQNDQDWFPKPFDSDPLPTGEVTAEEMKRLLEESEREREAASAIPSETDADQKLSFSESLASRVMGHVTHYIHYRDRSCLNAIFLLIQSCVSRLAAHPNTLNPLLHSIWPDFLGLYRVIPSALFREFFRTLSVILNSSPEFLTARFHETFLPCSVDYLRRFREGRIPSEFLVAFLEFFQSVPPAILQSRVHLLLQTLRPFAAGTPDVVAALCLRLMKQIGQWDPASYESSLP